MSRYFDKNRVPDWASVSQMQGAWELYRELVGGIPEGLLAKRAMLGTHWAYVEAESGVGVAMTVHGGAGAPRLARGVDGMELRDVAALSVSWSFEEATIGVAALNAWYGSETALREIGASVDGGDGFDSYRDLVAGKRVAVIGHFPLIERLSDLCELTVLERSPQPGDIPDPACEYIITEQDYLFSTGITLQNKTLPRLLELAAQGGVPVLLVGPSAVPAPALFERGVVCVAGSAVPPDAEQDVKRAMEQGSRSDIFGHGLRKVRVEAPEWRAPRPD